MACYLIHFDTPIGNERHHAQHYVGYTSMSVRRRIVYHQNGWGHGRLVQVAIERGITWAVAREWPLGDRILERRLKHRYLPALCPICSGEAARKRGNYE